MTETLQLALPWAAGAGLGVIFFGGLWWTAVRGISSRHAALWFFCSLLLRVSIVMAGFYYVGGGHWKRLLICLLGFVMARFAVTWITRPSIGHRKPDVAEASHAP